MENENSIQSETFENRLTISAIGFLKESAKWCKLMAIVGFIGVGLMVLAALFILIGFSAFDSMTETSDFPLPIAGFSVLYLIIAGIYFLIPSAPFVPHGLEHQKNNAIKFLAFFFAILLPYFF